jgi:hypothetical protein
MIDASTIAAEILRLLSEVKSGSHKKSVTIEAVDELSLQRLPTLGGVWLSSGMRSRRVPW